MEINKRVNYPVKKFLVHMQNRRVIKTEDPANPTHCFCVSWIALRVASVGTRLAIQAWNDHPIPGVFASNEEPLYYTHKTNLQFSMNFMYVCMYVICIH